MLCIPKLKPLLLKEPIDSSVSDGHHIRQNIVENRLCYSSDSRDDSRIYFLIPLSRRGMSNFPIEVRAYHGLCLNHELSDGGTMVYNAMSGKR